MRAVRQWSKSLDETLQQTFRERETAVLEGPAIGRRLDLHQLTYATYMKYHTAAAEVCAYVIHKCHM